MVLFEGKTKSERNKIIAAGLLGLIALIALYLAFGRSFFSGSTSVTVKVTATPRPNSPPAANRNDPRLPTPTEQDFAYQTTMVDYRPGSNYAPDPGRNIFAFYEPPPPTPYVPTPTPTPKPLVPPTPAPTPVMFMASLNPQSVYAGVRAFRLEINGDRFTPDARIYFNQSELPTTFVNGQRVFADVPANLIAQEGSRQVIVQTPDGRAYSNQSMLTVLAPPRPTFQYIGMIGRKRYNNDTAYFTEGNNPTPFGARLNDVVRGQFRLVDISPAEVVFEDVNLGFRHRVPIVKSSAVGGQPGRNGFTTDGGVMPFDPARGVPGMNGVPQYIPPRPKRTPSDKKDDVDDNGDGGN